ncbi:hypothetical protein C8Q75DRAFT_17801 [Abortiporus biennis]|nr:hypothetical protein C8Q75DRAFT_17801 [Abortiporus biennis]
MATAVAMPILDLPATLTVDPFLTLVGWFLMVTNPTLQEKVVSSSDAAIAGSTHFNKSNGNHGQAGSAYTGSTGSVNGGSVYNSGRKVINGAFSNNAGKGGYSISGDAYAGNDVGGGNAYSGSTSSADGGSVYNSGGTVINGFDSNTAGKGGVSRSGNAIAGSTH